jgi:hypothetical protein
MKRKCALQLIVWRALFSDAARSFFMIESQSRITNMNKMQMRLATASCLIIAGVFFVLFPIIRPYFDESSIQGSREFASNKWVIAHSLGIGGFILLSLGFLGLYLYLRDSRVELLALRGFALCLVGAGLTLPFFGAEAFGIQVIGSGVVTQNNASLIPLVNQLRFGPRIAFILSGLVCAAAATIIVAAAVWKSHALPKWGGIPLAAGFAAYIPQLEGDPAFQVIRIGVGILILIGCCWLAWGVFRRLPTIPTE